MTFGEKLKILRESQALTQEELCAKLSARYNIAFKRHNLASWEVGRHYPELRHAVIIGRYFKVNLDDLFYDEKTMYFMKLKKQHYA